MWSHSVICHPPAVTLLEIGGCAWTNTRNRSPLHVAFSTHIPKPVGLKPWSHSSTRLTQLNGLRALWSLGWPVDQLSWVGLGDVITLRTQLDKRVACSFLSVMKVSACSELHDRQKTGDFWPVELSWVTWVEFLESSHRPTRLNSTQLNCMVSWVTTAPNALRSLNWPVESGRSMWSRPNSSQGQTNVTSAWLCLFEKKMKMLLLYTGTLQVINVFRRFLLH